MSQNSQKKHLCWSFCWNLFFKKVSGLRSETLKETQIPFFSYRFCGILSIATRKNIVWKLARSYCLCYCKIFSLVPDPTGCTKKTFTKKWSADFYKIESSLLRPARANFKVLVTKLDEVQSKGTKIRIKMNIPPGIYKETQSCRTKSIEIGV